MNELTIFAKRLKEAREKRKLKQNALALKIGVTAQTISAYEKAETNGKGKNPTLENAVAIANELGVSLDWLCGREELNSKNEDSKNLSDIARDLVSLEKSIANIYLDTVTRTEEYNSGGDGYYPDWHEVDVTYPAIVITNHQLAEFICDWEKIKSLHDSRTIDDELYGLWLDKHISELCEIQINTSSSEPNEIDIDGELPF